MDFLKSFQKELQSIDGVGTSAEPPRYWYSTGNHVCNYIISGNFKQGIPQGRITNFSGPSGAGKSFNVANAAAAAQKEGAHCLIIDSENALDNTFMSKVGVDVENNYTYVSVVTIAQVQAVVSAFLKGYKKEYGTALDAPKVFIAIDSLDMLMTETELENYDKGIQKGDQGQRNKQLKAMLRGFVHDISPLNVSMVVTSQVYKNQDVTNGEGVWMIADAVKYSASQIVLVTKLKLKGDSGKAGDFAGIRMKCEGYKTRFTKPFQTVTIEVPYESGIDRYSGLKDVALGLGIIVQKGAWLSLATDPEVKFYERNIGDYADFIIAAAEALTDKFVTANVTDEDLDLTPDTRAETKARQAANLG